MRNIPWRPLRNAFAFDLQGPDVPSTSKEKTRSAGTCLHGYPLYADVSMARQAGALIGRSISRSAGRGKGIVCQKWWLAFSCMLKRFVKLAANLGGIWHV